jgi:hypothetical protein
MKWYSYLKNSVDDKKDKYSVLKECETIESDNMIICWQTDYRKFTKFINYLEFARFMVKDTKTEERCFYEVIDGEKSQRPYFDIDLSPTGINLSLEEADESIKCLVQQIYLEINEIMGIDNCLVTNNSHILVFTSHSTEKLSYHVIVEGFSVSNYKENRAFFERVVNRMPEKWKKIVDHSMYKSIQQFRIAFNTKFKTTRYKTLNHSLSLNYKGTNSWIPSMRPESEEHIVVMLLASSMITLTSFCRALPAILKPATNTVLSQYLHSDETFYNPLTPEEIHDALALCYKFAGLPFGDVNFPYSYLNTVENNGNSHLILLRRHRPSNCQVCNRVHEHENPYLIINGINRDVYLDCRRNSENRKLHVGGLGPRPQDTPVIPSIVETPKIRSQKTDYSPLLIKQGFNIDEFTRSSKTLLTKKEIPKKEILLNFKI